jgi:RNA polymerase sigma factor (TIGR02999 family)
MSDPSPEKVTQWLVDWGKGDESALERLTPLVYEELHRLASRYMGRERPGHVLQTTALVNEAYLRLVDQRNVHWQNRAQFFGIAAQMMRRILVDHARRNRYAKRGGGAPMIPIDEVALVSEEKNEELLILNDALERLSAIDQRKTQVVELRYFGGLSVEETAEVLKISPNTVLRDWNFARAWLHREIKGN